MFVRVTELCEGKIALTAFSHLTLYILPKDGAVLFSERHCLQGGGRLLQKAIMTVGPLGVMLQVGTQCQPQRVALESRMSQYL